MKIRTGFVSNSSSSSFLISTKTVGGKAVLMFKDSIKDVDGYLEYICNSFMLDIPDDMPREEVAALILDEAGDEYAHLYNDMMDGKYQGKALVFLEVPYGGEDEGIIRMIRKGEILDAEILEHFS